MFDGDPREADPATQYLEASKGVEALVAHLSTGENDPDRAAYFVARAAILMASTRHGYQGAAEIAYRIADEFASVGKTT